jgi:hypothetical protein
MVRTVALVCTVAVFSVSATDYYVSNDGNDSFDGTSDSTAWQTLSNVNELIPQPGDRILLRRGDRFRGGIVVNASGVSGAPIVYGAYGSGNPPVVSGCVAVTDWEEADGGIYDATVSEGVVEQVFIDGEPLVNARIPNSGYFTMSSVSGRSA